MLQVETEVLYTEEDVERYKELFNKYSQFDKSITLEDISMQHKDDHKIPVEISSRVFELDGMKGHSEHLQRYH